VSNKKKTSGKSRKRISAKEREREEELKRWIIIVVISALTLTAYLRTGPVGIFLNNLQRFLFGRIYFVIMGIVIVQILLVIVNGRTGRTSDKNPIAIILIVTAVLLWCAYIDTDKALRGLPVIRAYAADISAYFSNEPVSKVGGGIVGAVLYALTTFLLDRSGTILVIVVLLVISALLLVNLDVYKQAFHTIVNYFSTDDDEEEEEEDEDPEETEDPAVEAPAAEAGELSQPAVSAASKLSMISADQTDPAKEDEPEIAAEPENRSAYDIRADQPAEAEEPGVQLMGAPAAVQPAAPAAAPRSIFMNVDDLVDQVEDVPEVPTLPDAVPQTPVQPQPAPVPAPQPEPEPEPEVQAAPAAEAESDAGIESARKRSSRPYHLPPLSLLDPIPPKLKDDPNIEAAQEKGELLIQVLRNFEIEAQLIDTHIGPAVTKFEIRPDANVKVSKILNLTDDVKMQLAVRDIRIEAPIPGHNAVGVEIPNVQAVPVKMKECVARIPEKEKSQPLLFILGKDLLGNVITCRLDKMPHLLIAGATGSGKSVCMNAIITSLLLRTKPDDVKMLLVDPKKVEFTPYQKIPHLIGPVINDAAQASNALKAIVKIMEDRYDIFSKCGVRNIQVYNEKVKDGTINEGLTEAQPKYQKMPYIVVIIDELADLMVVAGKEVESSIQRITQLARAAGIHLIVATQRPSTDVITGIIKANIPSRIAFSVSSGIDSRTILDHIGAERLLGNGDMLYLPIGQSASTRVQGVFVTDAEVQRICDMVSSEAVPMYDDVFVRLDGVDGNEETAITGDDADPLYEEVKSFVIDQQKASTSLLQRRFGIGYNRSARMIDLLEQKGIIGPAQGSKPRDVYIKKDGAESRDEE